MYNVEEINEMVRSSLEEYLFIPVAKPSEDDQLHMDIPTEQIYFIIDKVLIPLTISIIASLVLNRLETKNKNKHEGEVTKEELTKLQIDMTKETDEITSPWGITGLPKQITEKLSIRMEVKDERDLDLMMSIIKRFRSGI